MKNIVIIGIIIWLLFFNGLSYISNNPILKSAPQTIAKGVATVTTAGVVATRANAADRSGVSVQKPQIQVRTVGGSSGGSTTRPVIVPQGMPNLPTAVPPDPTSEPPTLEPTPVEILQDPGDLNYPSQGLNAIEEDWALQWVPTRDGKSTQDCLYLYSRMIRYCWAPGYHPPPEVISSTLQDMKNGSIPTEPIKSFG